MRRPTLMEFLAGPGLTIFVAGYFALLFLRGCWRRLLRIGTRSGVRP